MKTNFNHYSNINPNFLAFMQKFTLMLAVLLVTVVNYAQTAASQMDVTGSTSTNTISNNTVSYVENSIVLTTKRTIIEFTVMSKDYYTSSKVLSNTKLVLTIT